MVLIDLRLVDFLINRRIPEPAQSQKDSVELRRCAVLGAPSAIKVDNSRFVLPRATSLMRGPLPINSFPIILPARSSISRSQSAATDKAPATSQTLNGSQCMCLSK